MSTYIIAEAGINHNGSLDNAFQLIDTAVAAGVDAIKFQTYVTAEVMTFSAPKAAYQLQNTDNQETQYEMAKKCELSFEEHEKLQQYCATKHIDFLSTPFDLLSIDMLVKLGLNIFKIPSGEITNYPYLKKMGGLNKEIIMSTGMATMEEVETALSVITNAGTEKTSITLLHCTSAYPAPIDEVNLQAIASMKNRFKTRVGYSDHTIGIDVAIAAVALGAEVIEKHITLDKKLPGPDHAISLEKDELWSMVHSIRRIEQALGNGIKKPTLSEMLTLPIARKSIVAARPIYKGELFSESNITVKRPAAGMSPMCWSNIIGKQAKKDFNENDFIE